MSTKRLQKTFLYEEARRRLEELKSVLVEIDLFLAKAPPGKIKISKSNGTEQYYLRDKTHGKSGKYIRKSEKTKISQYLKKHYYEKLVEEISKEIVNLEQFLSNHDDNANKIKQIYSSKSEETKSYIKPIDESDEDYVKKWLEVEYERKPILEDNPIYITDKGERVRSKTEINIANCLYKYNIPYRYEYPIKMKNGIIVHPDFMVLNVKERKVYLWEHRGMMDNMGYTRKAVLKLRDYWKNNWIVGKNMIITEESADSPLGTNDIEAIIKGCLM